MKYFNLQKFAAEAKIKMTTQEAVAYLGLNEQDSVDKDKVVKAYRKKALRTHPDAIGSNEASQENFEKTNVAYNLLLQNLNRQQPQYDYHGEYAPQGDLVSLLGRALNIRNPHEHLYPNRGSGSCELILLDSEEHSDRYILDIVTNILGKNKEYALPIIVEIVQSKRSVLVRASREECTQIAQKIHAMGPDTHATQMGRKSNRAIATLIQCTNLVTESPKMLD